MQASGIVGWINVLVKWNYKTVCDEETEVKYPAYHLIKCQNLKFRSLIPKV